MKMSEVFELPIHNIEFREEDGGLVLRLLNKLNYEIDRGRPSMTGVTILDIVPIEKNEERVRLSLKAILHAVNNHDRLVETLKKHNW